MTRAEIIEELRRSSLGEWNPWFTKADEFVCAAGFRDRESDSISMLSRNNLRIFYLLVACALERP